MFCLAESVKDGEESDLLNFIGKMALSTVVEVHQRVGLNCCAMCHYYESKIPERYKENP